jgi:hypothetical protein
MADDDLTSAPEEDDEGSRIQVPSRDPLPPPPDVHYSRPVLNQGLGTRKATPLTGGTGQESGGFGDGASSWGRGLSISITFVVTIAGGFLLGQWMDHHLFHNGSQIWCTFVMSIVGFALAFVKVIRLTSGWEKDDKK